MASPCKEVRFGGISFLVRAVDPGKEVLRLFWKHPGTSEPFRTISALDRWVTRNGNRLEFATNAGIYEPGLTPTGLHVADGRRVGRLNLREGRGNCYEQPNGVVAVGAGRAAVVDAADCARIRWPMRAETQSGPLLVKRGTLHRLAQRP